MILCRRHLLAAVSLAAATLAPLPVQAIGLVPPYANALAEFGSGDVSVSFVTANGQPLWQFPVADNESYLGGEIGQPYRIVLRNPTPYRVLAIVSVDGVNVISGQNAAFGQSGYVIEAQDETTIDGWRKSMSEVAQFVFSTPGRSYAGQTGRLENVGVIGVALYQEAPPPGDVTTYPGAGSPRARESGAPQAESRAAGKSVPAPMSSPSPGLGTAHGDRQGSHATQTDFRRATAMPYLVIQVRYDTLRSLEQRGIAQRSPMPLIDAPSPQAFPAQQFVPDPPRRR